jgi:hypothetical protein
LELLARNLSGKKPFEFLQDQSLKLDYRLDRLTLGMFGHILAKSSLRFRRDRDQVTDRYQRCASDIYICCRTMLSAGAVGLAGADSSWRSAWIAPLNPEIHPENLKGHLLYV